MSSALQNSNGNGGGGNGGGAAPGAKAADGAWLNVLPQEYRNDPEVTRYPDLNSFLKGHRELRAFASQAVRIPGEKATEAERTEFYTKLGWPGGADKYEIKFDDGVPIDENLLSAFTAKANELHLPKGAAQELAKWWAGQASAAIEGNTANLLADREKNQGEWKKEYGYTAERELRIAARGLATLLGGAENPAKLVEDPLYKLLDERGITDNPLFLKRMAQFARDNGEAEYVDPAKGPSADDLQTATDEYNATMNADKKTHPYWNANLPGHEEAVKRMRSLREVMTAGAEKRG